MMLPLTSPTPATSIAPGDHTPLTPLGFLERAAAVHPDRPSIVTAPPLYLAPDGERWPPARLRAGPARHRTGRHTVAIMAPNIPEIIEAHHGVRWPVRF